MNNPIIEAKNLSKTYFTAGVPLEVLKEIDFVVYPGEVVSIVGESGSGKSTLLNLLGGLDYRTSGEIIVKESSIDKMTEDNLAQFRNQYIGFVFQFHYLLPDFSALENVMLPNLSQSFKKKRAKEKAMKLLKAVGLEQRADHRPNQLSGGEQQRVAIARALVNDPLIVFADEPTGNLDEKTSREVQELLWSLREKYHLTIVVVTHNMSIANKADRKVRLAYGKIAEINNHTTINNK